MMPSRWTLAAGLFGAGVAVGYAAHRRGIPQEQVPRWLLKEATRKALHVYDAVRDRLPDSAPVPVDDLLEQEEA